MKSIVLLVFCSLIIARPGRSDDIAVTFRVMADTMPPSDQIYIAGNHGELGNWESDEVVMISESDSTWTLQINIPADYLLEYKFTRGTWRTEAIDSSGMEYPNFSLRAGRDTTVHHHIPGWRDVMMNKVFLSFDRMQRKSGQIELIEDWLYHPGDDARWADPEYDDRHWKTVSTIFSSETLTDIQWPGIGWFRLHIEVDSSLWMKPLSFFMYQGGASEVYLNGGLLYRFGVVDSLPGNERTFMPVNPQVLQFSAERKQLIAVRYSTSSIMHLNDLRSIGFYAIITDLQNHIDGVIGNVRTLTVYQTLFTVLPMTLAVLHLFIFAFYRSKRENLFFALCMFGFAVLSYTDFQTVRAENIQAMLLYGQLSVSAVIIAFIFGLLTTYISAYDRIPLRAYLFITGGTLLIAWTFFHPSRIMTQIFYLYLILGFLEISWLSIRYGIIKQKEEWISVAGILLLLIFIVYQILIDNDLLNSVLGTNSVYVYGIMFFSLSVSVNLARNVARVNTELLLKERSAREQEIQRRILETDNQRKTRELEEARRLQLSMLPQSLPEMPQLEIAVHMQTATEVGGDYYDFMIGNDQSLTTAVGDATGHGIRAGMMVALIKNLFNTMGHTFYIPDFFQHCTRMIKRMNLGLLYMSLLLLRIRGSHVTYSSAGMPPVLIFRRRSGQVEEMVVKGIPLGAVSDFTYGQKTTKLEPGDVMLLMSDGFAELFNETDELLDYPRIKTEFQKNGTEDPRVIIDRLLAFGRMWRGTRAPKDDITFMVLKYRTPEIPATDSASGSVQGESG